MVKTVMPAISAGGKHTPYEVREDFDGLGYFQLWIRPGSAPLIHRLGDQMPALTFIFTLLALLLTGLVIPVLIFGGWILLALTGATLLIRFVFAVIRLAVTPVGLVMLVIDHFRVKPHSKTAAHPQSGEPGYYEWANRLGEYSGQAAFANPLDQSPGAVLRRRIASRKLAP